MGDARYDGANLAVTQRSPIVIMQNDIPDKVRRELTDPLLLSGIPQEREACPW